MMTQDVRCTFRTCWIRVVSWVGEFLT